MCFCFLRSDGQYKATVGDLFVGWDGGVRDEEDCVVSCGHAGDNALRKAAEVVGKGSDPSVGMGPAVRCLYSRLRPEMGSMAVLSL